MIGIYLLCRFSFLVLELFANVFGGLWEGRGGCTDHSTLLTTPRSFFRASGFEARFESPRLIKDGGLKRTIMPNVSSSNEDDQHQMGESPMMEITTPSGCRM